MHKVVVWLNYSLLVLLVIFYFTSSIYISDEIPEYYAEIISFELLTPNIDIQYLYNRIHTKRFPCGTHENCNEIYTSLSNAKLAYYDTKHPQIITYNSKLTLEMYCVVAYFITLVVLNLLLWCKKEKQA
jgi:hypothetical protein